jgi:hypothetical protein
MEIGKTYTVPKEQFERVLKAQGGPGAAEENERVQRIIQVADLSYGRIPA